jgi:hypothetical protein
LNYSRYARPRVWVVIISIAFFRLSASDSLHPKKLTNINRTRHEIPMFFIGSKLSNK